MLGLYFWCCCSVWIIYSMARLGWSPWLGEGLIRCSRLTRLNRQRLMRTGGYYSPAFASFFGKLVLMVGNCNLAGESHTNGGENTAFSSALGRVADALPLSATALMDIQGHVSTALLSIEDWFNYLDGTQADLGVDYHSGWWGGVGTLGIRASIMNLIYLLIIAASRLFACTCKMQFEAT